MSTLSDNAGAPLPDRFAPRLLEWFAGAMRPLPWRKTYSPYSVWISEIMLQQTQMERGVRYFTAWMKRFPDIRSVAEADERDILAAWEGLGYYSRARNLHAAARQIMSRHGGVFPSNPADIRALPGVGEYTAGAIAAIAFNLSEPAVDANVLRIFARIRDIDRPVSDAAVRAAVTALAREATPVGSARLFCQALMELGALICGKVPRCGACPVREFCAAFRNGTVAERPVKRAKAAYTAHEAVAGIVFSGGLAYIRKRPAGGLWAGLWEFPGGEPHPGEAPEEAAGRFCREALGAEAALRESVGVVRHGYTTHRVVLRGYIFDAPESVRAASRAGSGAEAWIAPGEAGGFAFSAGHRKLLELLGWK